jgi:hypothetical protein
MSSYEPLLEPEPAGPGVWLGGELSKPPDAAEIHARWLPDAQPCYVLTRRGWVVDHKATALLMRSLRSPNGA